jgi:hypothetical protein
MNDNDWFTHDGMENRTVHEPDDRDKPKPTGVLNSRGVMIYRTPEPVGFRLKRTSA